MKSVRKILQVVNASVFGIAMGMGSAGAQTPGAPLIGSAVAGDAQAFVFFTAPAASGSSAISTYTASCNPGSLTGSGTTAPIAIAGLSNGTAYDCSVTATNATGSSAPSATVSVEPRVIGASHRIVFQFNATINSFGAVTAVDDAAATVQATAAQSANEVLVTLAAVPDTKRVTISLPTVNGVTVNASPSLAFMVGDVDATRTVTHGDVSAVKSRSGQMTVAANFRSDVSVSGAINSADISAVKSRASGAPPVSGPQAGTIMFVTQVPTLRDFAGRASTFGNHLTTMEAVARGGDLMIRYPDGTIRNLTQEAGFGMNGMQLANAIAVREPTVHWSGNKAVFSMVVGAPTQRYQQLTFYWQMYEVTGLAKGQIATITKVPNQPATYNNISPLYGTDDRILFTSDRPRNGQAHLYPQLDEYESDQTVTGIWRLNPVTGDLHLLNHAPSGAFSPSIDSYGRVIFVRWDHLQQDQQADSDRAQPATPIYGSFNTADEGATASTLNNRSEVFPETRAASIRAAFGSVNGYTSNFFTPWQMNEDGTEEETLNHIGRHELSVNEFLPPSFRDDPALSDAADSTLNIANKKSVRMDGGLFHLREDPVNPGTYFGIAARESESLTSDQIVKLTGAPSLSAESMTLTNVTAPGNGVQSPGGRFRNPLPLQSGGLVASHTPATSATPTLITEFLLKPLTLDVPSQLYQPGASLTAGITKSVSWWSPDEMRTYSGLLWEIEAVEVVARPRPSRPAPPLEAPEAAVFSEEQVDESVLRTWLRNNNLAMIVTRNQTSRDRGDKQQPFNLQVPGPGGAKTVAPGNGRVYDISHFQIYQADLIRGYENHRSGRRVIAQPMHDANGKNPANPGGPPGSVKIAPDGSTAAFVPARRALAWQTTDAAGNPVVRERVWITVQPGEVRVCASCHGANNKDQAGNNTPTNKPEALRELLRAWKLLPQ